MSLTSQPKRRSAVTSSYVLALTSAAVALLLLWTKDEASRRRDFLVYEASGYVCRIVIPHRPSERELAAARLVAETLARATGRPLRVFSITREWPARGARAIHIGRTAASLELPPLVAADAFERPVAYSVTPQRVVIRTAHPDDIEAAAGLFLEETAQAAWFVPGALGAEVAVRPTMRLPPRERRASGAYHSRNLGGVENNPAGTRWYRANRLVGLFPHGHTANAVVPPAVMAGQQRFAPHLNGARFLPSEKGAVTWQPDLAEPSLAPWVAQRLVQDLQKSPAEHGVAFGLNDTFRFDQSERTLALLRPERYFRGRPDYSDLLFSFLNDVAANLRAALPDKVLTTYAYDWTENTPRFRVAENIVPYLTADRSMWFDAGFAANDRALIERWGKAGPRFFGLYDYYYGAPFLVPRPTLWAVTEAIPYAYEKGARAFYAEATPNWALDGPKPWLAAQLLWEPKQDSARLLDEYYSRFWKEAAEPMRGFYELCDRQWREQPKPAVWVKYLKDDDQRRLFPPDVRAQLRRYLDAAEAVAQTTIVRERVKFVADAFRVTEAFCRHDEVREELQRLVFDRKTPTSQLRDAYSRYTAAREKFVSIYRQSREKAPLAIQTASIDDYLRCDPRGRVVDEIARRGEMHAFPPPMMEHLFEGKAPSASALQTQGRELLGDPEFRTLSVKQVHPFALTDWVERGPWGGKTEPTEHRKIELTRAHDGAQSLRYSGCNQETLWQWKPAQPGHLYRATVQVKGHVNPGTMVYLLVPFLDKDGQHIGAGRIDRLPVGDWPDGVTLEVLVRAPARAVHMAASLRTLYQVPGDWTEWARLSLRDLGP